MTKEEIIELLSDGSKDSFDIEIEGKNEYISWDEIEGKYYFSYDDKFYYFENLVDMIYQLKQIKEVINLDDYDVKGNL